MAVALVIALTMREKPLAGRGEPPRRRRASASDERRTRLGGTLVTAERHVPVTKRADARGDPSSRDPARRTIRKTLGPDGRLVATGAQDSRASTIAMQPGPGAQALTVATRVSSTDARSLTYSSRGMLMPTSRMLALTGAAGTVLLATVTRRLRRHAQPARAASRALSSPVATATSATQPAVADLHLDADQPRPGQADRQRQGRRDRASKVDTLVKVKAERRQGDQGQAHLHRHGRQGQEAEGHGRRQAQQEQGKTWTAAGRLEPAAAYTLTMTGKNTAKTTTTTDDDLQDPVRSACRSRPSRRCTR